MQVHKVKQIIAEVACVKVEVIADTEELTGGQINMDFLDVFELALELSIEFEVDIEDEVMEQWATVHDVVEYIETVTG